MAAARRAFVVLWILLGIAGALNHTIALKLVGGRVDLLLPHLAYGHVMFNLNPRQVSVHEYARADGVRHPLTELVATTAPGYARARMEVNLVLKPDYLGEVCLLAMRASPEPLDFFVDQYEVEPGASRLTGTRSYRCDPHGLAKN